MVLKEKYWPTSDLRSLISGRVTIPVAGDISCVDLGIKEVELRNEMWRDVDVVVNLAATVRFDERYVCMHACMAPNAIILILYISVLSRHSKLFKFFSISIFTPLSLLLSARAIASALKRSE